MTNANKVKVSKEVAEAIERRLTELGDSREHFLERKAGGKFVGASAPLNTIAIGTLAQALYVGYEIEEISQDIVNERIKEIRATIIICSDHKRILDAEMRGIKLVVDAFNLEGVDVK